MGHGHDDYAPHGAFLGHAVPGSFFIIWGSWWLFSCMREHILATPAKPYQSKAWFELPQLPGVPLEPYLKIFFTFVGIFGELWVGQKSFTYMYDADGTFNDNHINNWQHAAMYFGYMVAGIVDVAGHFTELPADSSQAALAVAFIVEGLLLGFHLKGSPLEIMVHKILVITIAASAVVMLAEIRYKDNVLLTAARAMLVGLQGIWFIQIGYIMFRHLPQWDPHSMKGTMMAPALYCLDIMLLTLGALGFYLALRLALTRLHGGRLHAHQPLRTSDEEWPAAEAHSQPGTIKLDGLPVSGPNGALPSNGHADRWAPAKSVQLADF